jgi:hypothetical protein
VSTPAPKKVAGPSTRPTSSSTVRHTSSTPEAPRRAARPATGARARSRSRTGQSGGSVDTSSSQRASDPPRRVMVMRAPCIP